MTPIERIAVEAIALLPGVPEEARRLLTELASGGRDRGEGPLSAAEKMKRYRERLATRRQPAEGAASGEPLPGVTALLPGVTEPVTASVTAAVTVGGPPDPPEIPSDLGDLLPSERGSETRVRAAHVTSVTEPVTASVTRATNITADGAGGLAVTAWAEGIRTVTRKPFSMPRGGSTELATLIHSMVDHCPDHATRVEWARDQARRFAESYKGKLNAFSFRDWLNSPDGEKPAAPVTPSSESPRAREERARREREMREAERNRAAPPPEAIALARGRPTPKAETGS